ncbi:hypothetical protein BJ322DRAFT_1177898 [Thelephora terrestris]|uniref:Uncharacterized protein n=1 Tax=Thelephora terrestris TaxID=56493 RepID=A0A9P6HNW8_9AGAM|nr:hypothetical protein BJ322DRAFT_1177898 [Thelephora terrestris]
MSSDVVCNFRILATNTRPLCWNSVLSDVGVVAQGARAVTGCVEGLNCGGAGGGRCGGGEDRAASKSLSQEPTAMFFSSPCDFKPSSPPDVQALAKEHSNQRKQWKTHKWLDAFERSHRSFLDSTKIAYRRSLLVVTLGRDDSKVAGHYRLVAARLTRQEGWPVHLSSCQSDGLRSQPTSGARTDSKKECSKAEISRWAGSLPGFGSWWAPTVEDNHGDIRRQARMIFIPPAQYPRDSATLKTDNETPFGSQPYRPDLGKSGWGWRFAQTKQKRIST